MAAVVLTGGVCGAVVPNANTVAAEEETATVAINPYYGGYSNCTWTAWQLCYEYTGVALPRFGNAGSWYGTAAAMGYSVGTDPRAMSIAVWSGHVAFVTAVSDDGSQIYIKEGGWVGGYNEGWVNANGVRTWQAFYGYIYIPTDGSYPVVPLTSTGSTYYSSSSSTTTMSEIVYKEVEEDNVVRVDDVSESDTVKSEDKQASEVIQQADKEQRAASSEEKLSCE